MGRYILSREEFPTLGNKAAHSCVKNPKHRLTISALRAELFHNEASTPRLQLQRRRVPVCPLHSLVSSRRICKTIGPRPQYRHLPHFNLVNKKNQLYFSKAPLLQHIRGRLCQGSHQPFDLEVRRVLRRARWVSLPR